ncbi:hypothetical protein [Sporosarcina sp. G11-34]|uniref:hypothetical protein n=1 Tax=Sporosarcina sp. G11-34 TaxID=2849605 RepID=UPI0022A9451F|nr:hypothetical protein [Sporosarcina sp. G11-34]
MNCNSFGNFLDLLLAVVVIRNAIAVLFLSGKVREIKNDYFTNIYPKAKKKINSVSKSKTASSLSHTSELAFSIQILHFLLM